MDGSPGKATQIIPRLTSLRCDNCRDVLWDADVKLYRGCPHCGGRRFHGSGGLTQEQENWLRARSLDNYEKYMELERKAITSRLERGLDPHQIDFKASTHGANVER